MSPTKQAKPQAPQLLFHESLARDLSEKLFADVDNPKATIVAKCFGRDEDLLDHQVLPYQLLLNDDTLQNAIFAATKVIAAASKVTVRRTTIPVQVSKPSKMPSRTLYNLQDLNSVQTLERLIEQHGRMAHMGVRDHAYQFYLNRAHTGALSYRLIGKVAVISGDPICPMSFYRQILAEFKTYCKSKGWQFAMASASRDMAATAQEMGWTTMRFARERVLNVQSNPVLLGAEGKRVRTQCKQTMKAGTQLGVYCPAYRCDFDLEARLSAIYEEWRASRNSTAGCQAYVTVFDMFSLHRLMTFIYSKDSQGHIIGFAALRKMKHGYHIDPCIATADAPRGVVDLLMMSSMALLREAGVVRLALGVEPLEELGEITGMSKAFERLTRRSHHLIMGELPLGGKKGFNDRFRPDEALEEQLYLIYPNSPSVRQSLAMAHFANVSLQTAIKQKYVRQIESKRQSLMKLARPSTSPSAEVKEPS